MTFEIHFTLVDGAEDYIVISGETVEEVREKAQKEIARRNGQNPWSKEI